MSQTAQQTAAYRAKRRAAGLCLYCATPTEPDRALCPRHAAYNRAQRRQWRQARKQATA